MAIVVQNRQGTIILDIPALKRRLHQVMIYLDCSNKELSVVFADDRLLQELNRTYRHKDRPTNVLAFPQPPVAGTGPTTDLLGDVIVSLPTAASEAGALGQAVESRVLYLLVHGLLHLLGYDHEGSAADRRRMETLEQELLAYLRESC